MAVLESRMDMIGAATGASPLADIILVLDLPSLHAERYVVSVSTGPGSGAGFAKEEAEVEACNCFVSASTSACSYSDERSHNSKTQQTPQQGHKHK